MENLDLILSGGMVVSGEGQRCADVGIKAGKIQQVAG